jgi:hypothetical protein
MLLVKSQSLGNRTPPRSLIALGVLGRPQQDLWPNPGEKTHFLSMEETSLGTGKLHGISQNLPQ